MSETPNTGLTPCSYCATPDKQTMRFLPASQQMQCLSCLRIMPIGYGAEHE